MAFSFPAIFLRHDPGQAASRSHPGHDTGTDMISMWDNSVAPCRSGRTCPLIKGPKESCLL